MTTQQCQELHINEINKEWVCSFTGRKAPRWIFSGYQCMTYQENQLAFDQICDCCEVPNQD